MATSAGGREYYKDAELVASFTSSGTFEIPSKKFRAFLCKQETAGVSVVSMSTGATAVISSAILNPGEAEILPISAVGDGDIFISGSTLVTGGTCKVYGLF